MKYNYAEARTATKPASIMESDARGKKRFFVSLDEVPMTEVESLAFAEYINNFKEKK
jgi:hypothetical protein